MKNLLIGVLLIIFTFTACKAQKQKQTPNWIEFVSKSGNFRVLFPTKPDESIKETGEGALKKQTYWFSVSQPEKTFIITYADYPNAPIMNQEHQRFNYDNLQNGIIKQSNAKLISERDVWLNERLGREFTFVDVKNITVTYRTYLIDKRFFQVITSIESPSIGEESKKEVSKFLDSFQIIDK